VEPGSILERWFLREPSPPDPDPGAPCEINDPAARTSPQGPPSTEAHGRRGGPIRARPSPASGPETQEDGQVGPGVDGGVAGPTRSGAPAPLGAPLRVGPATPTPPRRTDLAILLPRDERGRSFRDLPDVRREHERGS